jgi:hypothetical protein
MVFLVTFLSINKKITSWRLLVEGSGVYEGLSLVIGTPHPLTPSPKVGGGIALISFKLKSEVRAKSLSLRGVCPESACLIRGGQVGPKASQGEAINIRGLK